MDEKLYDLKVTDRKSFVEFTDFLLKDFIANGNNWENNTLQRFLEALSAYAEDIQGSYNNWNQNINADEPSWKVFADILRGAVIYE